MMRRIAQEARPCVHYCAADPQVLSHFDAEAKKRQAHGKTAPGKHSSPNGEKRKSAGHLAADDAAAAFDTLPRQVQCPTNPSSPPLNRLGGWPVT